MLLPMGDEAPPLLVIYPNGDLKQAIRGRGNLGYRRCVTPFLIAAVCRTELLTPLARPRPAWQARATKTAARQGRKDATAATGVCRPYPHRHSRTSCGKAGLDHCHNDWPSCRTRRGRTPRHRLAHSSVRTLLGTARAFLSRQDGMHSRRKQAGSWGVMVVLQARAQRP